MIWAVDNTDCIPPIAWDEGRCVMTWNSDGAGVLLYSILATLLVLSWIYIPA